MQRNPLRVDMKGAVPIPVGHSVEVWLLEVDGGLLAADTHGTMVRHTETGIVYAPFWAYQEEGAVVQESAPIQLQLHSSVRIVGQWSGRVEHCRIVTTRSKHLDQVTTLMVQRSA